MQSEYVLGNGNSAKKITVDQVRVAVWEFNKLEAGGHEVVETVHKNAVLEREKMLATVEGLKQSSTLVLGINSGVAVFGNGKTVQAAAQGEVDALFDVNGGGTNQIAKVTPVFGVIDLTKLEAGDIAVLNTVAAKLLTGDWSNINDNTDAVKDATLKGILDNAKTLVANSVNDGAVENLITAEFGSLPNVAPTADAVRKALLIAALAGKDANAIKNSIDN